MLFLIPDGYDPVNCGSKHKICEKLEKEVEANVEYDKESENGHSAGVGTCKDAVLKEGEASEKKNACINDRAYCRASEDRKIFIDLFQSLIRKTCAKTRENTLDHNRYDGARNVEQHKRSGLPGNENDHSRNSAEPGSAKIAVKRGSDNNGNQSQVERGCTDGNSRAKCSENSRESCQES